MSQIGTLVTFSAASLMKSAEMNQNFADCRTAHNSARQFIGGAGPTAGVGSGATNYFAPATSAIGLQAAAEFLVPDACVIDRLYIKTTSSQPASGSLVVMLLKNNVATAVTLTVNANAAAGVYSDTSHSAAFAAHDRISLQAVNNAAATSALFGGWSIGVSASQVPSPTSFNALAPMFAADVNANDQSWQSTHDASDALVGVPAVQSVSNGVTRYSAPDVIADYATETDVSFPMPQAVTLRGLVVQTSGAVPSGGTLVVTMRKNGVDTAAVVTVPAGSVAGTYTDPAVTAVGFALGDLFTIKIVNNSSGVMNYLGWLVGARFSPLTGALTTFVAGATTHAADATSNFAAFKTAHNAVRWMGFLGNVAGAFTVPASGTRYVCPGRVEALSTTEAGSSVPCPVTTTLRNLSVRIVGAQPGGGSLVATLRVNAVDTALTVTFTAGATGGTIQRDTTHSAAVTAGDLLSLKFVNNDGATASATLGAFAVTTDL